MFPLQSKNKILNIVAKDQYADSLDIALSSNMEIVVDTLGYSLDFQLKFISTMPNLKKYDTITVTHINSARSADFIGNFYNGSDNNNYVLVPSIIGNSGTVKIPKNTSMTFMYTADKVNSNYMYLIPITPRQNSSQYFTSSATNKYITAESNQPSFMELTIVGGGGGGGSGRKGAAGSARSGGAGGSGGAITKVILPYTPISDIIIGAGGTGGLSVTSNNTNGNIGGDGGASSVKLLDGTTITSAGGKGGAGGATAALTATVGTYVNIESLLYPTAQAPGGPTSVTGVPSAAASCAIKDKPGSGGGGGGISTGNTAYIGGSGTSFITYLTNGTTGTTISNHGVAGSVDTVGPTQYGDISVYPYCSGPGGGAASITTNAQNGADGYFKGSGGAGGGASVDSIGNSGAGGAGMGGYVSIRYF